MTQIEAVQAGEPGVQPATTVGSEDSIMCAWGLWVSLRGFSRGLLPGSDQDECGSVATYWLDLVYMVPYPPSDSPLPFCDEHRTDVRRQFEGSVPNWRLGGEEALEAGRADADHHGG